VAEGWARDEWDIALQEATGITLYRLVRDLLSGQWRAAMIEDRQTP
jgi:hypothetical protein